MRRLDHLDKFRVALRGMLGNEYNGMFIIPHFNKKVGMKFRVIAGCGAGWDHVSVSLPDRIPTWTEMCFIKKLFFEDHELAVQFHPPESDYVNVHPNCLHLWRPHDQEVPMPPLTMV